MDRAPRRGGRPPLDTAAPSVSVHVRVSARQYDAVYAAAQQERLSVSEYIRRQVARSAAHADESDDE